MKKNKATKDMIDFLYPFSIIKYGRRKGKKGAFINEEVIVAQRATEEHLVIELSIDANNKRSIKRIDNYISTNFNVEKEFQAIEEYPEIMLKDGFYKSVKHLAKQDSDVKGLAKLIVKTMINIGESIIKGKTMRAGYFSNELGKDVHNIDVKFSDGSGSRNKWFRARIGNWKEVSVNIDDFYITPVQGEKQ